MEKENYCILMFGQKTFRSLQIRGRTFRTGCYFLIFTLLFINLLLCDYIQLKRKTSEIGKLRQEINTQMSQIQFFSDGIKNLERQVSKLKDLDRKIRIIASVRIIEESKEEGYETSEKPLIRLEEKAAPEGIVHSKGELLSFQARKRK